MKELLKKMNEFESRNNLSIDVILFSDGSFSIREYWDEEEFIGGSTTEELMGILDNMNCQRAADGRCIKPIIILKEEQ